MITKRLYARSFILFCVVFAVIFGIISVIEVFPVQATWSEPSSPPPADDIGAPLNSGSNSQTKLGGLDINGGVTSTKFCIFGVGCLTNWAQQGMWSTTTNGIYYNSGNVGIGTTTPAAKLAIKGSGIGNILIGQWLALNTYAGLSMNGSLATGDYNILSSPSDRSLYLNRPTGQSMYFRANNLDQMVINPSGNVGIGTSTPLTILDIESNSPVVSIFAKNFAASSSITLGNTGGGRLTGDTWNISSIITDGGSAANHYQVGDLVFKSRGVVTDSALAEKIRFTRAGNLVVGGKLQIKGGSPGANKVLVSDATGLASWSTTTPGAASANGTLNYVSKFTPDGKSLGNSLLTDDGSKVTLTKGELKVLNEDTAQAEPSNTKMGVYVSNQFIESPDKDVYGVYVRNNYVNRDFGQSSYAVYGDSAATAVSYYGGQGQTANYGLYGYAHGNGTDNIGVTGIATPGNLGSSLTLGGYFDPNLRINNAVGNPELQLKYSGGNDMFGYWGMYANRTNYSLNFWSYNGGDSGPKLTLFQDGVLGINTPSSPITNFFVKNPNYPSTIGLSGKHDAWSYSGLDLFDENPAWSGSNYLWSIQQRYADASGVYEDHSLAIQSKDNQNIWRSPFTILANGNVGINNTHPTTTLDISGRVLVSGQTARITLGNSLLPSTSSLATTTWNIDNKGGILRFFTEPKVNVPGTEVMRVFTNGNIDFGSNTNISLGGGANTNGLSNIALGSFALYNNTSGQRNISLGNNSMVNNIDGHDNVALGFLAGPASGSLNNTITIGYQSQANASDTAVFGNQWIKTTLLYGSVGIGTSNPGAKLDVSGGINANTLKFNASTAPTCNLANQGLIYFNSTTKHFMGCNGTLWTQLDNDIGG